MSDDTVSTEEDKAKALEGRMNRARQLFPKKRIYAIDTPAGVLIIGTPARGEYLAYRSLLQSESVADRAKANDQLLTSCAIDPTADEYIRPDGLFDLFPGLTGNGDLYLALQKAAGVIKEEYAKK